MAMLKRPARTFPCRNAAHEIPILLEFNLTGRHLTVDKPTKS